MDKVISFLEIYKDNNISTFPHMKRSKDLKINLSINQKMRIYKLYKKDFEIFSYTYK